MKVTTYDGGDFYILDVRATEIDCCRCPHIKAAVNIVWNFIQELDA